MILDDFESELNTKTPEGRQQIKNWVTAAVYPAIDFDKNGFLWCNGTIVHYDSFLNGIVREHDNAKKSGEDFSWDVVTYKAILDDGTPLWPSRWPIKKLEERKQFYIDSGTPAKFYQEYMMEVQSLEDALWTRHHIKYWKGYYEYDTETNQNYIVIGGEQVPVNTFIGCDPATDINTKESDFSVIMAIAIDKENNLYVLEYERHRSIPTIGQKTLEGENTGKKGVVDYIMEMHQKYHAISSTVEDVAMNRSVFQALNEERRKT